MVRIGRIGIDTIAENAHELLPIELRDVLQDPEGAVYFEKTWPLQSSGHGRFSVRHGQYARHVTYASIEALWRDYEVCPPTAPLGIFIGALMHCIAEHGAEQQAVLASEGHPNALVSTPEFSKKDWE
jgi:hypothetical protein